MISVHDMGYQAGRRAHHQDLTRLTETARTVARIALRHRRRRVGLTQALNLYSRVWAMQALEKRLEQAYQTGDWAQVGRLWRLYDSL